MIINKAIVHVLDKNAEVPVLNDVEGVVSPELDTFYQKIIRRILRDTDLRKATFNSYNENEVRVCADHIIYDENSFALSTQGIASKLYKSIGVNAELDSCDLAVVLFTHKDQKYVAIIKLDYKKLYTHEIAYNKDTKKVLVKMVANENAIQESQKIVHAAIIGVSGVNDEWHLRVLDKAAEKNDTDSGFVTEFLDVKKIIDNSYCTKKFAEKTKAWSQNAYPDDLKKIEEIESLLNYTLTEDNSINTGKFAEEIIEDDYRKQIYKEVLEDASVNKDFEIDKNWVEKKLKRRTIKTNTGFDIKGLLEDFEDPMKYSLRQNQDGTFDITIKNIEFYN
jgi:hypothetical protein